MPNAWLDKQTPTRGCLLPTRLIFRTRCTLQAKLSHVYSLPNDPSSKLDSMKNRSTIFSFFCMLNSLAQLVFKNYFYHNSSINLLSCKFFFHWSHLRSRRYKKRFQEWALKQYPIANKICLQEIIVKIINSEFSKFQSISLPVELWIWSIFHENLAEESL